VEKRQGLKIACPAEIAYRMGFIDAGQLLTLADHIHNESEDYLRMIARREDKVSG
jgi:glucose-1-phosphate thymidylyltransferase